MGWFIGVIAVLAPYGDGGEIVLSSSVSEKQRRPIPIPFRHEHQLLLNRANGLTGWDISSQTPGG